MPICLTGMHRSHTSMLARILFECGVNLGRADDLADPNEDNQAGFWEDLRFQTIDERLLALFGASWDRPELPKDWINDPRLADIRNEARALIATDPPFEPWGWKDPRSCVTLSFWAGLIADLKVVVSLRSPVEVARSLLYRRYESISYPRGIDLWSFYYRALGTSLGRIPSLVVHSDALFAQPAAEIGRICGFLDVDATPEMIDRAAESIRPELRRSRFPDTSDKEAALPEDVRSLYREWCERAGPVYLGLDPAELARSGRTSQEHIDMLDEILSSKTERINLLLEQHEIVTRDRDALREEIARIVATRWHKTRLMLLKLARR